MVEAMHTPHGDIDPDSGAFVKPRRRARFKDAQSALETLIRSMLMAYSAPSAQGRQSDMLLDGVVAPESRKQVVTLGSCDRCRKWTDEAVCACGGHVTFASKALSIGSAPHVQTASGARALPMGYEELGTLTVSWSMMGVRDRMILVLSVTTGTYRDRARKCACGTIYTPTDMRCGQCRESYTIDMVRCPVCSTPLEEIWLLCPSCHSGTWQPVRGYASSIADEMTEWAQGGWTQRHGGRKPCNRREWDEWDALRVDKNSVGGMVNAAMGRWHNTLRKKGLI